MVKFTILAGGFSTFVATYLFDSDASTLTLQKQNPTGDNPSWIASHPQNLSILYAVNEIQPVGQLQSFIVDSEGGLTNIDNVTTGGNGPTFTNPLSTGEVTGMNFGSPNCSLVATLPDDPLHFAQDSPIVAFPVGDGPSNPHMSLEFSGEVFVPDLGGDKIWRLVNTGEPGHFAVQGQINIDAGAGPRHIAIHDNVLFTVHEKTSTLTAQLIPQAPNGTTFPLLANVTTIPADQAQINGTQFAAAEILISTPTERFPDPLIYVSNRNIGATILPAGDTIAIFQFKNGTLTPVGGDGSSSSYTIGPTSTASSNGAAATGLQYLRRNFNRMRRVPRHAQVQTQGYYPRDGEALELLAQIPTGLQQIRSMTIGRVDDGGDEFLIAGANTDGGVAVFRRVDGGKNLTLVATNDDLANRTSFVFV